MRKSTTALAALAATSVVGVVASTMPGAAAPTSGASSSTRLGAVLVGGNEVDTPGDPDGFGLADVRVSGREVCWRITVNAVEPIAAAHIHAGPQRVSGPVVVPLEPFGKGCTEVGRRLARFIEHHPSQFYVNVHNAEFPAGALRGQLRH